MQFRTKIALQILLILLLSLSFLAGSIVCIIYWPYIAAPVVVVILISFYIWKNRGIERQQVAQRFYYHAENNLENGKEKFSVMSYNVLADMVTTKLIYQNASFPILNFKKYRGPRIVDEISSSMPSVICMQEVDHYEDFYKKQLEGLGYTTFLNRRAKLFRHGTLIGFKNNKWIVEHTEAIDFNDADCNKKYKVHAAGIMSIAKSLESGKKVMVCNIHTYFIGNSAKYLQVAYATHRIQQFLQKTNNSNLNIPVVICGDFNAYQQSQIIQYLYGKIPQQYNFDSEEEFQEFQRIYEKYPYQISKWNLQNSYDMYPSNLPTHFTHYMAGHKGVLDYIFYSNSNLKVTQLLRPPKIEDLNDCGGTPNSKLSSDHIRIEAEFQIE